MAKATVFTLANLPVAAEIFLKMYPTAVAKGKTHEQAVQDIVHIIGERSKNWVREDVSPHQWGIMLQQDFENERKFLNLEGKLPDCIEACPVRALDAGPLNALEKKYGDNKEAVDYKFSKRTKPAVVIKAKTVPKGIR